MTTAARTSPTHGVSGFVWRAVTSSLGAKVVMAATGLAFYGWLVLHLAGNLGVFGGPETENAYAHFLKGNPEILWAQRLVWMVLFPIHIISGIRLATLNAAARPKGYASPRNWRQASLASRTMIISGLIVLAFFVFHLLQFTWVGIANSHFADDYKNANGVADVYGMVVAAFQVPWVAAFYVIGVTLVGFHLSHGLWSGVQSLGLNGRKWTPFAKQAGLILAIALAAGFAIIPISVLAGIVGGGAAKTAQNALPSSVTSTARP
jgi:succinate dehydrogenase / fumarate reductase cytochrome b subunit